MRHQLLSLNEYQDFLDHIQERYLQAPGAEYPFHKKHIALLKALAQRAAEFPEDERRDIYLGAIIYVLESIKREWIRSPEGRDRLYDLISKETNITKANPLNDEEKTIYLQCFKSFCEQVAGDKALLVSIHECQKTVKQRNKKHSTELTNSIPGLRGLQKIIKEAYLEYQEVNDKRNILFKSKKRQPMLRINDFLDYSCTKYYPPQQETIEFNALAQLRRDEYRTRLGIFIYNLMHIYNSYTVRSATNSFYYKNLLKKLNIKDIDSIPNDMKVYALVALEEYLLNLKNTPEQLEEGFAEWKCISVPKMDKNIPAKQFQQELDHWQSQVQIYRQNPSHQGWVSWGLSKGASGLTKLGIMSGAGYVTTQILSRYALFEVSGVALSSIAGPIGMGITVAATLFWALFSQLIKDNFLSTMHAYLFGWIFDRVDHSVGNTVQSILDYTFSKNQKGFDEIVNKLNVEDKRLFQRWINTLLILPNDIVSETEKTQIRNIVGIKPGEKYIIVSLPIVAKPAPKITLAVEFHQAQTDLAYQPILQKTSLFAQKNPSVSDDYKPHLPTMMISSGH